MTATGNDDNAGGEGRGNDDDCGSTSADNKQQSTKKGQWLGSRGGGVAEGEGTHPMQEERITTAMTND
jgi:hypothetical protein